jgi:LuxR family maltose regulon positive regulatory protein
LFATGPRFEPGTVPAVQRRTEGWVAGIYLAALAGRQDSRGQQEVGGAATIAGDDVFIADYFRDELLAAEPPESVRFLLRTSVLERMSGPLCDAIARPQRLGGPARGRRTPRPVRRPRWTGRAGGTATTGCSARCAVRAAPARARRGVPAAPARGGLVRAGRGTRRPAVTHALAGRDELTAARLINGLGRELPSGTRLARVAGAGSAGLDDDTLVACPPVAVTAAWIWALSGDPVRAQSSVLRAEKATVAGPLPDGSSSLDAAVATFTALSCPLGVDRMVEDARTAVRLELPGSPWRSTALAALGIAHVLTGQPADRS